MCGDNASRDLTGVVEVAQDMVVEGGEGLAAIVLERAFGRGVVVTLG